MTEAYDGRQVVGIDLHRQRSVIVRMTEDGRKLETVRITNSPAALRAVIARAGKNPKVVIEATYGWYWAVDVLEAAGAEVHLAHPLGVKAFSYRRVKNDERDAAGRPWGDDNRIHANPEQQGPFPAGLDHRLAGTRVKDASGAAAGGRAPPGP